MLNSLNTDKYLSKYDLINKYNLKNLITFPKLKKITIELSSQSIINSFYKKFSFSESDLKIKSYFILYLIQSYKPFIIFNNIKSSKYNKNNENFFLKIVLSNKKDLFYFLTTFFIESYSKLILEDNYFFNKKNIDNNKILNIQNFIISTNVSLGLFSELDAFINNNFIALTVKNLFIKINFCFNNLNLKKPISILKLIKNLNLFWLNK